MMRSCKLAYCKTITSADIIYRSRAFMRRSWEKEMLNILKMPEFWHGALAVFLFAAAPIWIERRLKRFLHKRVSNGKEKSNGSDYHEN